MSSGERASGSGQGGADKEPPKKKKAVDDYKIFNDSVHGHIKMDFVLMEIIDTPEFQRLRNIKQLGGGYYVFPGASHNRFEHSIGVAHLAGLLVQSLMDNQEELGITYKDKLCVQIAALCHDLGHGPFSHLFEDFMKRASKLLGRKGKWKHEKQSVKMFNKLIKKNKKNLQEKIKSIYDEEFTEEDFQFIRELIYGPNPPADTDESDEESEDTDESDEKCKDFSLKDTKKQDSDSDPESPKPMAAVLVQPVPEDSDSEDFKSKWPYKGRPEIKSFLFDILANKTTGIDVDKMDYFSRDCLHLGMKNNFSHERFVMFARVCFNKEENKYQICMRDKEALNMYEIFHVRYLLHNNVYQHRVKISTETMIVDALLAADIHLKISEAVKDPDIYLRLTDNLLQDIMRSTNPAKKIIERLETRDLYKFVGGDKFHPEIIESFNTDEEWKSMVKTWLEEDLLKDLQVKTEDIRVKRIKLNYGRDEDPIKNLRFYRKNDKDTAVTLKENEISYLLPKKFAEIKVMMLYTRQNQEILTKLRDNVQKFWEGVNLRIQHAKEQKKIPE